MSATSEMVIERFFEVLIQGDRRGARQIVAEQTASGVDAESVLTELYWPAHQLIDRLFRNDQLSSLSHRVATRLLSVLIAQTAAEMGELPDAEGLGKSVFVYCGPNESDEIAANLLIELLERHGYTTVFAGGQIPCDELLSQLHESRPDAFVTFCASPKDLPELRAMLSELHSGGVCPGTQVILGGGVFARAEGLAEEMGADATANDPVGIVDIIANQSDLRADPSERDTTRRRGPSRQAA